MRDSGRSRQKNEYYGVAVGRQTGVFTTWSLCHDQVNGFSGECHAGFEFLPDCISFLMEKGAFDSQDDINVYHNQTVVPLPDLQERVLQTQHPLKLLLVPIIHSKNSFTCNYLLA